MHESSPLSEERLLTAGLGHSVDSCEEPVNQIENMYRVSRGRRGVKTEVNDKSLTTSNSKTEKSVLCMDRCIGRL